MEYKVIKRHCNAVEMTVSLLDKETREKFINSVQYCTLSRPAAICKEIERIVNYCKSGYITLTTARDVYRLLGYEIEVSPIIDVKQDECYLIDDGKYRWLVALFDKLTNRRKHIYYSDDQFDSYNEALDAALKYVIDYELDQNPYKTNKQKTNMNNSAKASTGNQVDDLVNEMKESLNDVKQVFNESVEEVRSFVDDFNKSETKRELEETVNEVKETTTKVVKKGIKFGKAMFNAGKSFLETLKD